MSGSESITHGVQGMLHSPWGNNKLIMLLWTVQGVKYDCHYKLCPGVNINLIFLTAHPCIGGACTAIKFEWNSTIKVNEFHMVDPNSITGLNFHQNLSPGRPLFLWNIGPLDQFFQD